jgi:hypothetical protein
MQFTFTAPLWLYAGKGAWHFVTLPKHAADEIKFFNPLSQGFRPISVKATVGETTWKTSIFPDSKSGSYLLAIKAAVRKTESLSAGDDVTVSLQVISSL